MTPPDGSVDDESDSVESTADVSTDEASVDTDSSTEVDLEAVAAGGPVLLFDGVCNLCNGVVQFVIDRDDDARIRFASLQSDVGRAVLERLDRPSDDLDTVVLLEGSRAYTKSAAAIRVGEHLGGVYGLARLGRLLPRRLRDWLYDVVAANRYEWFGRREQCMIPSPELESRFVE